MGLGSVKTEGGGFQKVVFENVVDTLAGGLVLDLVLANFPDGEVPEGTLVGKDPSTGLGKVVVITENANPTLTTFAPAPLGLTYRTIKAEDNALAGVVTLGTARIKALSEDMQDNIAAIQRVLPRIQFV